MALAVPVWVVVLGGCVFVLFVVGVQVIVSSLAVPFAFVLSFGQFVLEEQRLLPVFVFVRQVWVVVLVVRVFEQSVVVRPGVGL